MKFNLMALIVYAVRSGTPLLFGTSGEILTEKSGNLNLGVEGLMYMGGAFGLWGAYTYGAAAGDTASGFVAVLIALICSFLAGCIGSFIFSFLTITLRVNQNVTGLALTILGTGVGQFLGEIMRNKVGGTFTLSNELKEAFDGTVFPEALRNIPVAGELIFSYNIFVYLGFIMAVVMALFLAKSRRGLYLRAVGEAPSTADSAGINVVRYKYMATVVGGGISAVGGMVYTMTMAGSVWNHRGLAGEGWISVALVIFCLWKPANALWGSVLFGALLILFLKLPLSFIPTPIYKIIPYIATAIVLILVSMRQRREDQPPAALGLPYFREER